MSVFLCIHVAGCAAVYVFDCVAHSCVPHVARTGAYDTVVVRSVVDSAVSYYNYFLDSDVGGNMTTEFSVGSEHCYPTISYGEECTALGEPYISR